MSIKDRPYVGTWQMNRTVVRYTPDAKVLINGHAEFASCMTCNKKLDFNKYITSISCDPTTDPITGANFSLTVPAAASDVFRHDGNSVLEPGLEVVILMRGYFPITGYAAKGQDPPKGGGATDDSVPVYPYYQVFRGVVTEVSHEFSGGFYTASVTCANILHFWQYHYVSTNGSVFGEKLEGGGTGINLTGHKFTGMSPYSIIYTLMRIGFGAAFGQNWTIAQESNLAAVDEGSGQSLYKHAALWWQKRWEESSMRLRMYGMDGSIFNAFEQAYLGMFDNTGGTSAQDFINSFNIELPDEYNLDAVSDFKEAARSVGYRGMATQGAVMSKDGTKLDALKMQAYTLDLGSLGSVNMFEGEYMSKLEIANTTLEVCGFEFYQDVDGDIVFKPPMYNLDTSGDEVYCIRDRDLVSISESESEPEATYVKGSGSLFQNFKGVLSGEFGTRQGKFVDWRLVAKFGWRETTFESNYLSSSKAMYISGIMRMDLANAEMRTASITIPLRPEMRPGYPVWVECLDCFFYVKGISHSFAVGSACQSTLTCVAKRPKFLPPGNPDRSEGDGSQRLPTLDDVKLSAPGEYPPMPLYVFPEDIEGAVAGSSGPPRIQGYPNVVLALDPDRLNMRSVPGGLSFSSADTLMDFALTMGILRRDPDSVESSPTYLLSEGNDPAQAIKISRDEIVTSYDSYSEVISNTVFSGTNTQGTLETVKEESPNFGALLVAVQQKSANNIEDSANLGNYLALQTGLKQMFGESGITGQYRYFSSSAPDESDQSPSEVIIDEEASTKSVTRIGEPKDSHSDGITVLRQDGDRIRIESDMPKRGFRIYGIDADDADDQTGKISGTNAYSDVTTKDIRFFTFQKILVRKGVNNITQGASEFARFPLIKEKMAEVFASHLRVYAQTVDADEAATVRFGETETEAGYGAIKAWIDTYITGCEISTSGSSEDSNVQALITSLATITEQVSTFGGSLHPQQRLRVEADAEIKTGRLWREGDAKAIENISAQSGEKLAAYLDAAQQLYLATVALDDPDGVWGVISDKAGAARAELLTHFDSYEEDGTGAIRIVSREYEEGGKGSFTPVLPVSDNGGYEVYGTLPYGRGLDITRYKSLLSTAGSPTTNSSMLAVETFFASLSGGASVSKVLGEMGDEAKAKLAESVDVAVGDLENALAAIATEDDSPSVFIRNTPVTSRSRGMSVTGDVAASALASLQGEGNEVCLCKGTDGSFWLQAFTGEFVELAGDESVNDFLSSEAEHVGAGWSLTKQALAGQMLDTRATNKLAEVIQSTQDTGLFGQTAVGGAITEAQKESGADWEEAKQAARKAARGISKASDQIEQDRIDASEAEEEG